MGRTWAKVGKKVPSTLEAKLAAHQKAGEEALAAFYKAANDLDASAADLENDAADTIAEADRLTALANQALAVAINQRTSATKIRQFFS